MTHFTYFILVTHILIIFGFTAYSDARSTDVDSISFNQDNLDCDLPLHRQYCKLKCTNSYYACVEGQCICISGDFSGLLSYLPPNKRKQPLSYETRDELYHRRQKNWDYVGVGKESQLSRRHHIAHFCPSLDSAKKCIIRCLKQGKPAYCGRDHQCYCSHTYKEPINKWREDNIDIKGTYNQFRDLYAKYFPESYLEETTTTRPTTTISTSSTAASTTTPTTVQTASNKEEEQEDKKSNENKENANGGETGDEDNDNENEGKKGEEDNDNANDGKTVNPNNDNNQQNGNSTIDDAEPNKLNAAKTI